MSASDTFPTFDSLRVSRANIYTSMDMLRVRWEAFGSLEESVAVADDLDAGAASSVSPYEPDDESNIFHDISESPATEPPVCSITVNVDELMIWPETWEENHYSDEGDDQEWVDGDDEEFPEEEGAVDENGDPLPAAPKLMRCCDQNRPHDTQPLVVFSTKQPFVTVHDYVTQVHAWLQGLEGDILRAWEEIYQDSTEMTLCVNVSSLDGLSIEEHPDPLADRLAQLARLRRDGTTNRG